ncbi:flagellar basal body rod protein FlgC [Petroclostridium sp. X23]|uniref:flagellar basal body rod protein FlgC n=1 Tax=Petroclostridium sp. X23 TaxID=3045146 RepID=UPI0024AE38AE|nr:flagellar basal body rod protein FlgC [Petroclostridium sp. X23]WHH58928.1 flagellar basal body rod protein FlgC [Petroclostridium sp. X23]
MSFLRGLDISSSGLTAQRLRMDLISQNIANADTTRTENGTPYRKKLAVFEQREGTASFSQYLSESSKARTGLGGVRVSRIIEDTAPFKRVHNPGHPDADENGYVLMPNVDVMTEMVNMISTTRSYEANVAAINSTKSMALKALEIGK